ncbi:unnamed protein product, partial [marine sediment metagenome]
IGTSQTVQLDQGKLFFEDFPKGMKITANISASDIDGAISRARGLTNRVLSLFSFVTKCSIPELLIMKAYDVTPGKKVGKYIQHCYDIPFSGGSARTLDKTALGKCSRSISKLEEIDNNRVLRSMHWFRLAIQSKDYIERFTSLWIGLETINLTLCKHYEIEVEYSTCEHCGKNAPILTGVRKLLSEIGDSNLKWREISKLRAITFHGSQPLHVVVPQLKEKLHSLQNALYKGLCLVLDLEESSEDIVDMVNSHEAHHLSTAEISGPDLQFIDREIVPTFDYEIGVVHLKTSGTPFIFRATPVIDERYKFIGDTHTLMAQPHLAQQMTTDFEME